MARPSRIGDGTDTTPHAGRRRWAAALRLAAVGVAGAGVLATAGCAGPGGDVHRWAQEAERQQCARDGNWWKPNDKIDGTGICDYVNVEN